MLRMTEEHEYYYGEERVPGVNEIFKGLGLIDTTFMTEEGAERGKRRHLLLEEYDKGTLDWNILPEDLHILSGWVEFIEDTGFESTSIELPVYHRLFHFAGTPDRVGVLAEKTWVIDIKTGSRQPWHELQTAMYALAYADTMQTDIPERGTVYLRQAKKKGYRFVPAETEHILDSAVSIIEAYHWQQGMKGWIADVHRHESEWITRLGAELGQACGKG